MLLLHKHPDVHELESRRDTKKLVKALHFTSDPEVRVAAAEALGRVGDSGVVSSLIEALADDPVRPAAVRALGLIGDPYAVHSLASLLDSAPDDPAEVCRALASIGPPALDALRKRLAAPDPRVRATAAQALGGIGDVRGIRDLIGGLHDPVAYVRAAAAGALDVLGWTPPSIEEAMTYRVAHRQWERCARASAIKPLIAVLDDDDPAVVAAASQALGRIGAAAVDPLIQALPSAKVGASDALVAIGAPAVDALVKALQDERVDVREAAADLLDLIGWAPGTEDVAYWAIRREWDRCQGEAAVDPLIDVLTDRWEDIDTRRAAARALVALYQSGRLDDDAKQKIVAQRDVITYEEPDWDEERFGNQRGPDQSIGVDFPL